jgi:hypothetical protein
MVAVLKVLGSGAEKHERQPPSLAVHSNVVHLLAHGFQAAEVVVLTEQPLKMATLLSIGDRNYPNLFQINRRML